MKIFQIEFYRERRWPYKVKAESKCYKGSVLRTIMGVALVTVMKNGLNVVGVSGLWQQVIFGIMMLFAVYMSAERGGRDIVIK
ncbi:MAG: hypothetical protein WA105_06305 [Candidatus Hydromicrobium sp.]